MKKNPETPKYILLKEYIKSSIENGELTPGKKIFSENELASRFGISRHTVRQAVGEMVNEGWLCRTQGSGTFVSNIKGGKREKTRIIGVITTYLDDYIFPGIIKGIDNVLSSQGYSMILSHTDNRVEREAQCISSMMQKNVDGFIIEPTKSALPNPNQKLYAEMIKKDIPFVQINGYYPGQDYPFVIEDDEAGGNIAASYLFNLGHRKIGGIFKVDDIQGHNRYKGVAKAHRERNFTIMEESVVWYTTEDMDALFDENGAKLLLKRLDGCTAVVCYNDQVAIKLLDVFRRSGKRVPEDVSVISFDDSELATVSDVKLTTIAHPVGRLGEKAANGLLDLLKYKSRTIREVIVPELIIRDSAVNI